MIGEAFYLSLKMVAAASVGMALMVHAGEDVKGTFLIALVAMAMVWSLL